MKHHNLQPKCITDFTTDDTIYINTKMFDRERPSTFLCQFVAYKGNRVIGRAIESTVNPELYKGHIEHGLEISEPLSNCSLYGENPINHHTCYHHFMSSGYAIYPKDYDKESENADIIKWHPSFGMIRLSRRQSRGTVLFGSSITHNEIIALTISRGEVDRHLNREWYHARNEIIEIEMSSNQFAEFITTPNSGSGIPCTIRHLNHDRMPEPPFESRVDMFSKEFKNNMSNLGNDLNNNLTIAKSILSKNSINKGDKEELIRLFDSLIDNIKSSIPFVEKSFVEQMDKTIVEAKAEIEAFVNRRITEEGRKALLGENSDVKIFLQSPDNQKNS